MRLNIAILSGMIALLVLFPLNSDAQAIKRGKLKLGGQMRVYGQNCQIKVLSKSTEKQIVVKCAGKHRANLRPSTLGTVYLSSKDELRITSKKCSLNSSFSSSVLNVRCVKNRAPEEATAVPSSTATPAPSLTATNTPTPTLTATPTPVADLIFLTASVVSLPVNSTVVFQVQNQSTTVTALNIQAIFPASWTDVTQTLTNVSQSVANCASVAPGEVCSIQVSSGTTPRSQADVPIKGTNTTVALTQIEIIDVTTLSSSVNNLALSVNNTGLNAALTGNPRVVTITNTGSVTAQSVTYSPSPALPSGTTISPSSCGSIVAGGTCALTITPGSTAGAAPADTNPTPVTLTINGSNTNTITPTVQIVTYGSVYQGGYVFSIDDSTPDTGSIGGKVAALTDQSAGILWTSDGSGAVNYTAILGGDELSTTLSPSPTAPSYPIGTPAYTACNGNSDGLCNSSNIISFYNFNRTSGGSAPTPLNSYAAGLCAASISGFADWYLPAICELGYDDLGSGTGCGTQASPAIQNILSNLFDAGIGAVSGEYWSSTSWSGGPVLYAWNQTFDLGNIPQYTFDKSYNTIRVRCTRALTP